MQPVNWCITASVAIFCLLAHPQAVLSQGGRVTALRPSIVCIGDGLTESAFQPAYGWAHLLLSDYTRKADVINRGFGGYYTPWMATYMLEDLFAAHNPKLAIMFLGLKDSMTPAVTGDRYISPSAFRANLAQIMARGKQAGVEHFLLITPPPVCEVCRARGQQNVPEATKQKWDRYNAHTQLYVNELYSLAKQYNGVVVDIFSKWGRESDWNKKYLLPDNLHLSETGNRAVHAEILAALQRSIPQMYPPSLPTVFPGMKAIDKSNPAAAFSSVVGVSG